MGLALGLAAALSWGLSDFTVAIATRRTPALLVALGFHLVAIVPLAAIALATGSLAGMTSSLLAGYVLVGLLGWLSYVTFYRALAIGPISVVSPVVAGYAGVTVVLAVLLLGEVLSLARIGAILLTFVGVSAVSTDVGTPRAERPRRGGASGIALALAAMLFFGGFVFGVSERHHGIGWSGSIFVGRAFAAVFLLAHAGRRGDLRRRNVPPRRVLGLIGLIAVLDTCGYVFFNLGTRHGVEAVVATASALYALVPVVLGVSLFGERPSAVQWGGVGAACAGVILLGVTG